MLCVPQINARESQSVTTVSGFSRVVDAAEQLRIAVHDVDVAVAAQKSSFQLLHSSCKVQ